MEREQFQSNLDSELRVQLTDQKPKNLFESARLADQSGRPAVLSTKVMVLLSRVTLLSQRHLEHPGIVIYSNGGFQKSTSFGYHTKPHIEQKPSSTTAGNKFTTQRERDRALGVCVYCKKPDHILPSCPTRRAEREQKDVPVHLVSTLSSQVTQGQVSSNVLQKQEVDPRFEGHCSLVTLRPDHTRHIVRALRDTGALQSLVSQQSISDCHYEPTGEFRLIRGVMGETVSVPLVRVTLQSSLCSGSFLCGLATSFPSGIDKLSGNDLCTSAPAIDVAVVTRSQAARLRREADLQTPLVFDPEDCSAEAESDSVDKSAEADLASLFESSVATDTIPFELVDRSELVRLQLSDTSLSSLYELAEKGDDHYFLKSAVPPRSWRDKLAPPESSFHQIVVPVSLRPKLLQIAHEIVSSLFAINTTT